MRESILDQMEAQPEDTFLVSEVFAFILVKGPGGRWRIMGTTSGWIGKTTIVNCLQEAKVWSFS